MRAGDERAFDEFFDGYFPGLYRFVAARVNGDGDIYTLLRLDVAAGRHAEEGYSSGTEAKIRL